MEEQQLSRAHLLIEQERFAEAEKILVHLLATAPNDTAVLSMLSVCLLEQDRNEEALNFINQAIGFEPDNDILFSTKARILISSQKLSEAEQTLHKAIVIDPEDANHYSLLAWVELNRKNYKKALESANQSLSLAPENLLGLNVRGQAQQKLGYKEASYATIQEALNEDPNNAFTHANFGWSLLEQGKQEESLKHFKEALSIDPNFEYAQSGMAEALKARYGFYRLFLKYSFWMSNMTAKYQWGVIIGIYVLFRLLRSVTISYPTLAPYLIPLLILLSIMAFSTWIMGPIGNLFLRFNKYGTHLLNKEEKTSSTLVGISLVISLLGFATYFFSGMNENWLSIGCFGFAMMIPLGNMFAKTKIKNILIYYTIALAIAGSLAIFTTFSTNELLNIYSIIFLFGFIAFQWIANFVIISDD